MAVALNGLLISMGLELWQDFKGSDPQTNDSSTLKFSKQCLVAAISSLAGNWQAAIRLRSAFTANVGCRGRGGERG